MRILLDEGVPVALKLHLPDHDVVSVHDLGWDGIKNGALLAVAEGEGFAIFITADKGIRLQNNLTGRALTVIALSTNYWPTLQEHPNLIGPAVAGAGQGGFVTMAYPRPSLRRRNRLHNRLLRTRLTAFVIIRGASNCGFLRCHDLHMIAPS
jgi:hypothetical protein